MQAGRKVPGTSPGGTSPGGHITGRGRKVPGTSPGGQHITGRPETETLALLERGRENDVTVAKTPENRWLSKLAERLGQGESG